MKPAEFPNVEYLLFVHFAIGAAPAVVLEDIAADGELDAIALRNELSIVLTLPSEAIYAIADHATDGHASEAFDYKDYLSRAYQVLQGS